MILAILWDLYQRFYGKLKWDLLSIYVDTIIQYGVIWAIAGPIYICFMYLDFLQNVPLKVPK